MSAKDRTNWFWSDWRGDQAVRRLTPAERGMWIDLLALAAVGNPTGYVCDAKGRKLSIEEIARFTNCASIEEASKLITGILEKGAASCDRTGRLYNRRSVREAEATAKKRLAGMSGGAATRDKWLSLSKIEKKLAVPQHVPQQTGPPLSNSISKTSCPEQEAAREAVATRPSTSFVSSAAKPNGSRWEHAKRPNETSRSEIDAMLAAKGNKSQ